MRSAFAFTPVSTTGTAATPEDNDSPSLLREWNNPQNRIAVIPEEPPGIPVAAAVVLPRTACATEDDNDDNDKPAASYSYPVATFVHNMVRTAHTYAGFALSVEDQQTPVTSVRSEAAIESLRALHPDLRRETQSESDLFLPNDDEYVLIDGDLVAVQAPPLVEYDDCEAEFLARQTPRNRMRRSMRGFRKWMKKRQGKRKEPLKTTHTATAIQTTAVTTQSTTISKPTTKPPAKPTTKPMSRKESITRKHERKKQSPIMRGLSWRQLEPIQSQIEHPQQMITPQAKSPPRAETRMHHPRRISSSVTPTVELTTEIATTDAVSADFIGTVASFIGTNALQNVAPAVAFIELDKKALGKIDKMEESHLEFMLQQARLEVEDDNGVEDCIQSLPPAKKPQAIQTNRPCYLSKATTNDHLVLNDTLKVILIGDLLNDKSHMARAIGGKKPKSPRSSLGVDVHTWTPEPKEGLTCVIWDVTSVGAGAHPSTQSLFFSPESLYILVWDLGASNRLTHSKRGKIGDEDDDDDNENDFLMEQRSRQVDRALEHDIQDHVLSWLDRINPLGSAVLPVASVTTGMTDVEVLHRCSMLQAILMRHPALIGENAPKLIFGKDSILKVNLDTGVGLQELQVTVQAIGQERVFSHVGSEVTRSTMLVLETIRRLKQDRKVILVDHLLSEITGPEIQIEVVTEALHFLSSIGEILYFGNSTDEILSRYVILSRKWLVSALSCILRPDLQRELVETRRFMNLQCVYSGKGFEESDIVQTLLKGTNSSCPILSAKDSAMLWQSMSFMRDAADRTAQLSEASNTMYDFLERLLVYSGILLPLSVEKEPTYYVPSLLDQAEPSDVWTYKTSEPSWMTALCHSWLLRDGVPTAVMEHVTTHLLQDLYAFSHTFQGQLSRPLLHAKTVPIGTSSLNEFIADHDYEPIGRIKIHQVMCWKSSVLVKIGSVFADSDQSELKESFTEIYVALVDDQSNHCVDNKSMGSGMKRLIVCGKGPVGRHGRKLWRGGYGLVLDSIKASLADFNGVDRHVVCPECLANVHPSIASTWTWENIQRAVTTSNSGVRCSRGHLMDTSLLCGTSVCPLSTKPAPPAISPKVSKPVHALLGSVVLVGLWDTVEKRILSVGSGFLVDQERGLVITAGHILFDMKEGGTFGAPYFGLKDAKVVIGVIRGGVGHDAAFRYFAKIVAHDMNSNVDACVLKIMTRLEKDVEGAGDGRADQREVPVSSLVGENPALKLTSNFELEESVRVLGYNQGGEGVLVRGTHINRIPDFAKGYICKRCSVPGDDDSSESSSGSAKTFSPREEIVVMCPTISGHSGGPCVNAEGAVVGILSRADPVDRQRCYLVPASKLKRLVRIAERYNAMDSCSY